MKIYFLFIMVSLMLTACGYQADALQPIVSNRQITMCQGSYGELDRKSYCYFPKQVPATGKHVFVFDPHYNVWAVYDENGIRSGAGRASGGSTYCPDLGRSCKTVVGTFKIISKRGANCKSSIYPISTGGGAPMPYCMVFASGGYAIHGSNMIPDYNASHGCIRIQPAEAKWLYEEFLPLDSTVIVLPYSAVESF